MIPLTAKDEHLAPRLPVFRTNYDYGEQVWNTMNEEYGAGKIHGIHDFMEKKRKEPSPIKLWREKRKKRKKKYAGIIEDTETQSEQNQLDDVHRRHQTDDERYKAKVHNYYPKQENEQHQAEVNEYFGQLEENDNNRGFAPPHKFSDSMLVQDFLDWVVPHPADGEIPVGADRGFLNRIRAEMQRRGLHVEPRDPSPEPLPAGMSEFWMHGKRFVYYRDADFFDRPRRETPVLSSQTQPPLSVKSHDTSVLFNGYYEEAADYWAEAPAQTPVQTRAVQDYVDYVSQVSAPEEKT